MTEKNTHPERSIHIVGSNYEYTFSRGILAHTLIDFGVDYEQAYALALKIQNIILGTYSDHHPIEISERTYANCIEDAAQKYLPKDTSERVKLILEWQARGKPVIILLAGVEGNGGTSIAKSLADRFSISQLVSTKYLANILRKIIAPELAPELHSETYTAYEQLRPIDSVLSEDVLIGFVENARFVTTAVEAIVRRALNENISLIIRGEHILPRYISKDILSLPNILYSAVTISSRRVHLDRLIKSMSKEKKEEIILNYNSIRKINDYIVDISHEMDLMVLDNKNGIGNSLHELTVEILRRIPKLLGSEEKSE